MTTSMSNLSDSPKSKQLKQLFDYIFVLDFEATCKERTVAPDWQNEIIEFPIVVLDVATGKIVSEFREYVRPTLSPKLRDYCTNLTGIEQVTVSNADTFNEVYAKVGRWYKDFMTAHPDVRTTFLTCGDWDLRRMLPEQLKLSGIAASMSCFDQWINVKKPFKQLMGNLKEQGGLDMETMLSSLKLPLIGRHHCGLDDARNIAAIATELINRGIVLQETWKGGPEKNLLAPPPQLSKKQLKAVGFRTCVIDK